MKIKIYLFIVINYVINNNSLIDNYNIKNRVIDVSTYFIEKRRIDRKTKDSKNY